MLETKKSDICQYIEEHPESVGSVPCKECSTKHNFPYNFCCLHVCGELEWCKGCKHGAYESFYAGKETNNA